MNEMYAYITSIENYEIFVMGILTVGTLWFSINTIHYYYGEKRKIKNLRRFAREGELGSQKELAQRYEKGNMIGKDCHKAAFWYQKAAFSGDRDSKIRLMKFFTHRDEIIKKKKC